MSEVSRGDYFLFFIRLTGRRLLEVCGKNWSPLCARCGVLACKLLTALVTMNPDSTGIANLTTGGTIGHQWSKSRLPRQSKRGRPKTATERKRPRHGTLAQTCNLILAALRVWELKRGIRD